MTILLRFLFIILLFLFVFGNHVQAEPMKNREKREKNEIEEKESGVKVIARISSSKKIPKIAIFQNRTSLDKLDSRVEKGEKIFKNLKEAQDYLRSLSKEREVFVKDFYGVNITAYRYVNIFDRLGYIRNRISEIDKEIKKTKSEINRLKNK